MYPSLPKRDVFNEIERRINMENFQPNVNKNALLSLCKLSMSYMTFQINERFYEQAEGLFIGSPTSPCFAEIFIQRLEEVNIYKMVHAPRIWLRKVDDTFTITEHSIKDTLQELNCIHNAITFTAEQESNNQLPFLDCLVEIQNDKTLNTKVFRKVTHTGQYINFHSNQPLSVKLSTITNLTRRAKILCSQKNDFHKEMVYIQKTMELNDYPQNIVRKTIDNCLKKDNQRKTKEKSDQQNQVMLYLPYEQGISEKIAAVGRKYNVRVINKKGKSLKNVVKKKMENQNNNLEIQGAVYKVNCTDCAQSYIGETGRDVKTRLKEHKYDIGKEKENISGLSKHIRDNKHNVDWENVIILHKENDFRKRKFKEAVAIKKIGQNETMNKKEEVKVISDIWGNII